MKRVSIHRIRQNHAYSIQDVVELLSVHENTVRNWINGLQVMDETIPILIHGSELKTFHVNRRASTKVKCLPHEFYCLKCRAPRTAWEGAVDIQIRSQALFNVQGICAVCGRAIHKAAGQEKLIEMLKTLIVQQVQPEHLLATLPPSLNCYLRKE